jgi:AhpD family alkylhydroperoxidase
MAETTRVNIGKQHPDNYKSLIALSNAAAQSATAAGLDPLLVELVRIRTSQINGCAFCLRMHTRDALKKGESTDRIAVLPAWEETSYFTETERAALRLAESITNISAGHVSDEDYAASAISLTQEQISAVAWLATVMNAFNRVAVTSRYDVSGDHSPERRPVLGGTIIGKESRKTA